MKIRTFLGGYGCAVVALLAVLSSVESVLGQQEVQLEARTDTPLDMSLGAVQAVPADDELSSEEQGHTQLDQSFRY